jgi:transmembrane sensor
MPSKHKDQSPEIFERYCRDQYTREDVKTIFRWFTSPGYDMIRRIFMKNWWKSLDSPENHKPALDYDPDQMLDRIHHQINIEQSGMEKDKAYAFNGKKLFQQFSRIAAVLILPLMVFTIYVMIHNGIEAQKQDIAYAEVYAPPNSRLKIQLPDGTRAWLNHGSNLKYPQQFKKNIRQVHLTGEAYFQVSEDKARPFQVSAEDINVKVTGTAFNVSAYQDDEQIITTVEEGKVDVQRIFQNDRMKHITELTATLQSVYFKNSKNSRVRQVNPKKYTGWKDGKLILIDDSMDMVEKKLERWYNVVIEIQDPALYNYTYTATFTHESIEQVLKYMSMATPIAYEIKLGAKQSDNSFTPKKILIDKK